MIELHTLGVENYFGLVQPGDVPSISVTGTGGAFPDNGLIPKFYVDNDVYEATRCLTGWRVKDSDSIDPNSNTNVDLYLMTVVMTGSPKMCCHLELPTFKPIKVKPMVEI